MNKITIGIVIGLLFAVTMFSIISSSAPNLTGYSVSDDINSFIVRQSLSSTGPITILSIIFAAAVMGLYEVRKQVPKN